MRRHALGFVALVLCGLALAPLVNLLRARESESPWWSAARLYNLDFAATGAALALYPLGISTDPQRVVIGREGWLYLGDMGDQLLSVGRRGQTQADVAQAERIGAAARAWERWLAQRGVRVYRVLIGPDKSTIYPEHLPRWAQPAEPAATDALVAAGGELYVDPRPALRRAKREFAQPLYFRRDSHWNALGGGVAFRAFAESVGRAAPELRWPRAATSVEVRDVQPFFGGDLARMLRVTGWLEDLQVSTGTFQLGIESVEYDFDSGHQLRRGRDLTPRVGSKPLRVTAAGAANQTRVLWLRDSFGRELAPLMAATFSDVVNLHWLDALQPGRFAELVERWRPQYVFVTAVERAARAEVFALPPPEPTAAPAAPAAH